VVRSRIPTHGKVPNCSHLSAEEIPADRAVPIGSRVWSDKLAISVTVPNGRCLWWHATTYLYIRRSPMGAVPVVKYTMPIHTTVLNGSASVVK
jgi:hypothetical protein